VRVTGYRLWVRATAPDRVHRSEHSCRWDREFAVDNRDDLAHRIPECSVRANEGLVTISLTGL
jgi:hypothetical protein